MQCLHISIYVYVCIHAYKLYHIYWQPETFVILISLQKTAIILQEVKSFICILRRLEIYGVLWASYHGMIHREKVQLSIGLTMSI